MMTILLPVIIIYLVSLVIRCNAEVDESFNRTLIDSNVDKIEVKIVIYDKVRGYLNWLQDWFRQAALDNCNTRCILTEYPNNYQSADVVLFHAPTRDQSHHSFPPNKPASTLYALFSMEQPKYARILSNPDQLKSFDVLMTYSLQTTYPKTAIPNIPVTYYPLNILSPSAVYQPSRSFKDKDGYGTGVNVVVFTSNCHAAGATGRYQYLQELMKHIQVHSYGKCFNNRQEPVNMPDSPGWPEVAQRRARKVKIVSHYKFYLAFENLAVDDYVSEKIFEGLFAGSLPIYRGSSTIHRFMPANDSYINANDMTAIELATLFTTLSQDEVKYNRYFDFKTRQQKQPSSSSSSSSAQQFEQIALMSYTHPNVLCRLCDYAVEQKKN